MGQDAASIRHHCRNTNVVGNYFSDKVDYETAIEQFDSLDSDDAKTREVYAHFGLTIFMCQLIEQQSMNMIATLRQVTGKFATKEEVAALWDNYDFGPRTLGTLINEIKQLYKLTDDDQKELKEILRLRNYFAHDYFRFNNELFFSDSGKKRMIKDFVDFKIRIRAIDKKLLEYMRVYREKSGMTEELIDKLAKEMRDEWEKKEIDDNHTTFKK